MMRRLLMDGRFDVTAFRLVKWRSGRLGYRKSCVSKEVECFRSMINESNRVSSNSE